MPHIMTPSLQPNITESIGVLGMGILPQINALMEPVFSPLISEGINNTLLSFNNQPIRFLA